MLTKQETKQTITSLELVEQINLFRKEEGKESDLLHKNLLVVIRDEFEEEIGRLKIQPTSYKDQWNRDQPMFVLTLSQAKQVLVRESKFVRKHVIAYLEQLEEAVKNSNNNNLSEKERFLLDIFRSKDEVEMITNLFKFDRGYVRPLEDKLEAAEEEVKHKKETISYLTDDSKLHTMRQFLNEIIRMKGAGLITDRWNLLYRFYENRTKMNLSVRIRNYNMSNKTSISKLEYIDNVLNDLNTLYEVAVRTFESDFKEKLNRYKLPLG